MPFHFKGVFSFFLMATRKALAVLPSASPILRSFTEIQNCRQKKALDKVTALASLLPPARGTILAIILRKAEKVPYATLPVRSPF